MTQSFLWDFVHFLKEHDVLEASSFSIFRQRST